MWMLLIISSWQSIRDCEQHSFISNVFAVLTRACTHLHLLTLRKSIMNRLFVFSNLRACCATGHPLNGDAGAGVKPGWWRFEPAMPAQNKLLYPYLKNVFIVNKHCFRKEAYYVLRYIYKHILTASFLLICCWPLNLLAFFFCPFSLS